MRYHPKVIDFFKRHNMYEESLFDYLQDHSVMLDYNDPEQRYFIGFNCSFKNGVLKNISIGLPYMQDYKTMLINIHEITHGIYAYKKLNKKYNPNIGIETLPMLYERIYILENGNEELRQYGEFLDSCITETSEEKYKFALRVRQRLLDNYNNDYKVVKKQSDKLAVQEELKLKLSKILKS